MPEQSQRVHVPQLERSIPLEDEDEVVLEMRHSNHLQGRVFGDFDGSDASGRHVDEAQLVLHDG